MQAGLTEIPAVVRDLSDGEAAEIAIIENVQREDLDPIEKGRAFRRLQQEFGLTQDLISERIGSDRSSIANFMRLLQLPAPIQEMVSRGTLTMGHARALITIEAPDRQVGLARACAEEGWSVRELERAAREAVGGARGKTRKSTEPVPEHRSPDDVDLVNRAQHHLGTRVHLRRSGDRGELVIEFYSNQDLDRILRKVGVLPETSSWEVKQGRQ
jgi:ParB family transcriptional regulator, chromosome partitioning protein